MSRYIEPIDDRTQTDIDTKTAKAFFNIADWIRVTGNTELTHALVEFLNGYAIVQTAVTQPTITTFPTAAEINAFCANIENIRLASNLPAIDGLEEIKDNWAEGFGALSPDYMDANSWERVLDIIYNGIGHGADYRVYCGVSSVGQMRFYQNRWRRFAWIEDDPAFTRKARTGIATTGTGLTWNNGFRRYT